jgi:hypothetical protein
VINSIIVCTDLLVVFIQKTKTTPAAITTVKKYKALHKVLTDMLVVHKKHPHNFQVVCTIHYILIALTGISRTKTDIFIHDTKTCRVCNVADFVEGSCEVSVSHWHFFFFLKFQKGSC